MSSNNPQILKIILDKQQDTGNLSPDAKKLLELLREEFEGDIFKHFFSEYTTLSLLGLIDSDMQLYFDEWCTEAVSIINENGQQKFINDKHIKLFGYSREELIGQSGYDLFPDEGKALTKSKLDLRKRDRKSVV